MSEENNIKNKMATLGLLGAMFGAGVDDRLIDRGFLYCIPCGEKRKVSENGDVEECGECKADAYNLYERRF
jgi:hypothetical protein